VAAAAVLAVVIMAVVAVSLAAAAAVVISPVHQQRQSLTLKDIVLETDKLLLLGLLLRVVLLQLEQL
jgi:hypothetical protein